MKRLNCGKRCLVLTLAAFLGSCNVWESKVSFSSSVAGRRIDIEQPFPANGWGLRVVLHDRKVTKTLYAIRGDVFLDFAAVTWTPNGDTAAILICGTPRVELAYKISQEAFQPFAGSIPTMASHIRSMYHLAPLTDVTDPIDWACSPAGKGAFAKAFPESVPR